ncbi:hypothetical protein HZH66_007549 [Vespula vulgaris]|uniref:Uncharacterized protein n=2 Tax=Vespula TaxID=7451 RepID=A0A834P156_VESPE|nr:hypothetical protein HZH66_007549 [Vespula vulgaris]KAF7423759.1 hypothetical protein H0235_009042 [Vespula pensylvanica]
MVVKRRVKEDSMREEKRVGEGEDGDGDGGGPPDNPERPVAVAPRGTIPQLAPLSLAIRTVDPLFANVGWRLPKTTELTRVRTTGVSLAMRGGRVGRELAERDGEAEGERVSIESAFSAIRGMLRASNTNEASRLCKGLAVWRGRSDGSRRETVRVGITRQPHPHPTPPPKRERRRGQ